ncbi:MAG TPA: metallophosphoesterase [Polyangiaceae bacterium]|nr:metallophosphoesterase [Polyangiaceae bacterium]
MDTSPALLIHLSDLHYCKAGDPAPLRESLVSALTTVVREAEPRVGDRIAVCVTGDLVDSSETPPETIASTFTSFIADLRTVVGRAPIVLLPGNHDRRGTGLFAPWSTGAMNQIAHTLAKDDRAFVHAANPNETLASPVPELSRVLGAHVVAYDSTHAIQGKISAGGMFRADDLLAVSGIVGAKKPVVVLIHHHLVPTPVADFSIIDSSKSSLPSRLFTQRVLPRLVAFADREELFMTALGAGTALTLLQALGSAALVLHGHKHYPTARLLRATQVGDGDVLLASAGSAGLLEPYHEAGAGDRTYLWPSFNVVQFSAPAIDVDTVWFSPDGRKPIIRQALARVAQRGAQWEATPMPSAPSFEAAVDLDQAEYRLTKSGVDFWDYECRRTVTAKGNDFRPYHEPIAVPSRGEVDGDSIFRTADGRFFASIRAGETVYRAERSLCRTAQQARRLYSENEFSPFEWVVLHVGKGARIARLILRGLPDARDRAFGTVTDLHTGQQRPMAIEPLEDGAQLVVPECPGRRLLRLCWPLNT